MHHLHESPVAVLRRPDRIWPYENIFCGFAPSCEKTKQKEGKMTARNRPATSTDAPFIAWVIQEAARSHLPLGIWDVAFPGPDAQRLKILETLAATDSVHFCHWSRFLIAEVNGEQAAGLSAYENSAYGGDHLGLGLAEAFKKLGLPDDGLLEMRDRTAPFRSIKYVNPDGLWIIEWVATKPEFRGKGIINGLLAEILDNGREAGFSKSQIGFILGNTPAKNAYEKVGFKWVKEYCHPDFEKVFGSPGLASMHLTL
jgi:GNAT superfamily N-acetyltransferase